MVVILPLASVIHLPKHIRSKCTSCEWRKLKPKKASLTRRRRIREFQRIARGKIRRTSRRRNSKQRREKCTRRLRISVNSKKGRLSMHAQKRISHLPKAAPYKRFSNTLLKALPKLVMLTKSNRLKKAAAPNPHLHLHPQPQLSD